MSGLRTDLLVGLAQYLDDEALGTWSTDAAYSDDDTAITLSRVPDAPDRLITLTSYGSGDAVGLSDSVIGVQVRCRWGGADPRLVDDLADAVFAALHNQSAWTLSSDVYVVLSRRISGPVSLGQDQHDRWSNAQNFAFAVHYPSTHRT